MGFLQGFVQWVLPIVAVGISYWAWKSGQAAQKLNEEVLRRQLNRHVVALLEISSRDSSEMELVIKNIGGSAARNITLKYEIVHNSTVSIPVEEYLEKLPFFHEPVSLLIPQQEIRAALATTTQLQWSRILISIAYEADKLGDHKQEFADNFVLYADLIQGIPTWEFKSGSPHSQD